MASDNDMARPFLSVNKRELSKRSTPLDQGEQQVFDFLSNRIRNTKWKLYTHPPLNGLRPDFVLTNPAVGIVIFEVKNWNTQNYFYSKDSGYIVVNKLENASQHVINPIDQLNNYREEIIKLYCPSLKPDRNNYPIFTAGLIFPQWSRAKIESVFTEDHQIRKKFDLRYPNNRILGMDDLNSSNLNAFLPSKKRERMDETICDELDTWLISSDFDLSQGRFPKPTNEQSVLIHSKTKTGYRRIRGPAGSGKTIVLAARAGECCVKNKSVLFLTYNITLMNMLKDQVSRYIRNLHPNKDKSEIQGAVFLYYHFWAKRFCAEAGASEEYTKLWTNYNKDDVLNIALPKLVEDLISKYKNEDPDGFEKQCYDVIIVDEGQDFTLNWWNNLRKILKKDGEIVLASDPTQDLYGTASAWTDEAMGVAGFSKGRWAELTESHRMPRALHLKTNDFAREFLSDEKQKIIYEPEEAQAEAHLENCFLKWLQTDPDKQIDTMVSEILELPKKAQAMGAVKPLSFSDIVFLTLEKNTGSMIDKRLKHLNFNVHSIFSQDSDFNRMEKLAFFKGSGRIKGSTIHSYKGLEARALVILIQKSTKPSHLNAIYTALTRLKALPESSFLTVVCSDPKFSDYAESWKGQAYFRKQNPSEVIEKGQTGIDYDYLFSECLEGAQKISLTDPYIITIHQFFCLQKLLETCRKAQGNDRKLCFHLITGLAGRSSKLSPEEQNKAFRVIEVLAQKWNIEFTYERSDELHDRKLQTDHGWVIILGRGIDIFQEWKAGDPLPEDELKLRKSRGTDIAYLFKSIS